MVGLITLEYINFLNEGDNIMPWIMRDSTTNDIIGEAGIQSSTFNESVLSTDPAYIAYLLVGKKTERAPGAERCEINLGVMMLG